MKIPDSVLSDIINNLDPIEVYGEYLTLKKRGNRYWALCPFHHEKTPSFTVSPEQGVFYCFGCHKGGSLYNFIMEMENVGFPEAVKILARKAGVEIGNIEENTEQSKLRKAIIELNRRIAKSFNYLLLNSEKARHVRDYLVKRRIERSTIEFFNLGYAPGDRNWLYNFLLSKHYSKELMLKSGLFYEKDSKLISFFRNRLIFPIYNYHGDVIGFGGRALDETVPKYINSPDSFIFHKKENVYGLYQALKIIRDKKEFILVEGYMDVLAVFQSGMKNVIAPLGTAFTEQQSYLLKRYANRGFLAFDGDEAGKRANARALGILESTGFESYVIPFDKDRDPAEIFEKEGPDSLKKMLNYSINGFQYLLEYEISINDFETPEGKRQIAESMYPFIERAQSEVKRDLYLNSLAEKIGVDYRAVYNDFISRRRGVTRNKVQRTSGEDREIILTRELFLMLAILINREYFVEVRKIVREDDLSEPLAKEIYIAMEESYRDGEDSFESVMNRIENDQLKKLIFKKAASGEFSLNVERLIEEGINEVRRQSLEKKRNEIIRKLNRIDREKIDNNSLRELLEEKIHLDEELEKLKVR